MALPLVRVDAFTDKPFAGNPAAVCLLDGPADAAWMQRVAAEMNLSETAFLSPQAEGFAVRWFTPTVEVDLCGHATLASAHVLWQRDLVDASAMIRFFTRSGELTAHNDGNWIWLDFPARPTTETVAPEGLSAALGVTPLSVSSEHGQLLVEVPSETILRHLQPEFAALRELPVEGVIVTSRADSAPFDFVSRYFAPAKGINEDPVTGSAHCYLAPFWSTRLDKLDCVACQASARGGVLRTRLVGDRVHIGGHAVTVADGTLYV